MVNKLAYLFKEAGGRLMDWFVFTGSRGLADGGLVQPADNAIRTLTHLESEGYEVIQTNIPSRVFGLKPEKYRELNEVDREELALAREELMRVLGGKEKFLAHCKHREFSLYPVG